MTTEKIKIKSHVSLVTFQLFIKLSKNIHFLCTNCMCCMSNKKNIFTFTGINDNIFNIQLGYYTVQYCSKLIQQIEKSCSHNILNSPNTSITSNGTR